ncbi:hypothetical protein C8R43DRAFT_1193406 [Mycena crocata]|nr:hypothetical protein C8R43DRAFT_1193406 [Mycena crocata]
MRQQNLLSTTTSILSVFRIRASLAANVRNMRRLRHHLARSLDIVDLADAYLLPRRRTTFPRHAHQEVLFFEAAIASTIDSRLSSGRSMRLLRGLSNGVAATRSNSKNANSIVHAPRVCRAPRIAHLPSHTTSPSSATTPGRRLFSYSTAARHDSSCAPSEHNQAASIRNMRAALGMARPLRSSFISVTLMVFVGVSLCTPASSTTYLFSPPVTYLTSVTIPSCVDPARHPVIGFRRFSDSAQARCQHSARVVLGREHRSPEFVSLIVCPPCAARPPDMLVIVCIFAARIAITPYYAPGPCPTGGRNLCRAHTPRALMLPLPATFSWTALPALHAHAVLRISQRRHRSTSCRWRLEHHAPVPRPTAGARNLRPLHRCGAPQLIHFPPSPLYHVLCPGLSRPEPIRATPSPPYSDIFPSAPCSRTSSLYTALSSHSIPRFPELSSASNRTPPAALCAPALLYNARSPYPLRIPRHASDRYPVTSVDDVHMLLHRDAALLLSALYNWLRSLPISLPAVLLPSSVSDLERDATHQSVRQPEPEYC